MSGIVGSRLNNRGSGVVGGIGTDGQVLTSSGAGQEIVFEDAAAGAALTGSTNNTVVTVTGSDTMAGEAKLLFDPPKLTIGDATAEDTKIVFDGNAQDFHIGLDDSTDSLTIGLGSTLGTTSHMVFDANGIITKPLQPCFAVYASVNQTPGSSAATVVWGGETLDVGSNFASNTFTAPVDGNYLFNVRVFAEGLGSEIFKIAIIPSGTQYNHITTADNESYEPMEYSEIIPLSASDTVTITTYANNSTYFLQGTSGSSYHYCTFSGCLLT